jgi:catechol 2,3-dioxygenase-like lactoylglutathione lyase family enzyme
MSTEFGIAARHLRDIPLVPHPTVVLHSRSGRPTMEQRVSVITLGVANLPRSTAFYERLGWRRSMLQAEGVAFFQAGGMAFALYPRLDLAKDANISADGHGFSGISLAYNARNRYEVESVLAEAVAAGAKLLKPAQEAFWGGYSGYFSDADGFLWEVAWNPSFKIAPDGSIQIPG